MSDLNDLVSSIVKQMGDQNNGSTPHKDTNNITNASPKTGKYGVNDYPLYEKHHDAIRTPSGKSLDDVTLEAIDNNQIDRKDLRITPEALKMQGDVAGADGRKTLQMNFYRAAELTRIPDDRLLEMYNALRPYRSTKQDLLDIANELRTKYDAKICAGWFEEAAKYYESRKKLKGDK